LAAIFVNAALFCVFIQARPAAAQQSSVASFAPPSMPSGTPNSWIQRAEQHELAILQDVAHPVRYLMRKQDRHGDRTREVIESAQGNVARLIQRDGKPITSAEDEAERTRLNSILSSPDDFLKHEQRDSAGRTYVVQLLKLMPSAMIFTYAPGQPQPAGATSPQVVIDFHPDPKFHPPTMVSEALTGLAGRIWIDARTGTMTRIQGDVLRPINFGWGVVARIYPGGHIELEQTCVDGTRWTFSHLEEDLTVREVMLHSVMEKTKMSAWNFQLLPAPMSVQDAVRTLLAEHIPLQ
jgi:hypothetical protein